MLRSNARFVAAVVALADLALISAAYWLTLHLRTDQNPLEADDIYFLLWAGAVPTWHLCLRYYGAYESMRQRSRWEMARPVLSGAALFAFLQFAVLYIERADEFSRLVVLAYPALAAAVMIALRWGGMLVMGRLRQGGYNYRNVLYAGANGPARSYATQVHRDMTMGLRNRGVLDCGAALPADWPAELPVVGPLEDLSKILTREPIDRVVFSLPPEHLAGLANYLEICEEQGVEAVVIPPGFEHLQVARVHVEEFFGVPVINYTTTPAQHFQLAVKRLVDIVVGGVSSLFLLPVFLVLAVAIRLESPGPVFFKQYRSGVRGRRFNCYKFRSMYIDAEARLAGLKAHNEMSGPVFKMKNDPRITRVGAFIRRYSLDELPQLFNVFRGDMSLVGPRPPLPAEVEQYEPWQRRRLSMKPGITCIWQVSGRNDIDFEQWMRLDLEYIDNWSLWLDFKLLFKTIPAVLRGTGV
jgi:exopolysaccharide biosynthesis polyprenyl glycosylphosphotransferase